MWYCAAGLLFIAAVVCQDARNGPNNKPEIENTALEPVTMFLGTTRKPGNDSIAISSNAGIQEKNQNSVTPRSKFPWNLYRSDFPLYSEYDEFTLQSGKNPMRIKMQRDRCLSCWASAVAAFAELTLYEERLRFHNRLCPRYGCPYTSFSSDELLDCFAEKDCKFRSVDKAMEYGYEYGFMPSSNYQKYGQCSHQGAYKLKQLYRIDSTERSIITYLRQRGPVLLNLYFPVSVLRDYQGVEVLGDHVECIGKQPNHAMVAVGYGVSPYGVKYWLLQNSWGTTWGEGGYIKWRRGINACAVEAFPLAASFYPDWYTH